MHDLQEEFSFFSAFSLSARVRLDQSGGGGSEPTLSRPAGRSCTVDPPFVASARRGVDSLRLNAAQLPLRLSPQLQEVKGQLLAQTGQPPRLGPPSAVALTAGRDRGAELKASSAPRGGGRNKNSPPSSGSSGVYKRDVGASCDVIQAAHWEQTSGNSISHKNPKAEVTTCFFPANCCATPVLTLHGFNNF